MGDRFKPESVIGMSQNMHHVNLCTYSILNENLPSLSDVKRNDLALLTWQYIIIEKQPILFHC